jgi:hypothetical protein
MASPASGYAACSDLNVGDPMAHMLLEMCAFAPYFDATFDRAAPLCLTHNTEAFSAPASLRSHCIAVQPDWNS